MKYVRFFLSFIAVILFVGCGNAPKIVQKGYNYEKTVFGNHRFAFDVHLENIDNPKVFNLVNKLIYDNRNFDEYMEYRERTFIENADKEDFPAMINEDGSEYIHQSELSEKYSIVFNSTTHILFQHNSYAYYSGMAHGISLTRYFIIDLIEQRILDIDDLINPIPDDLLKEIIASNSDNVYYLRENIWPPDTVNFSNGTVELLWNVYTILPYGHGPVIIEKQDEKIEPYLTDRGKALKRITANKR